MPGFSVTEIEPVKENGELWRGLRADYPAGVESPADGLDRRQQHQVQLTRVPAE
jgi:hypothetical protein